MSRGEFVFENNILSQMLSIANKSLLAAAFSRQLRMCSETPNRGPERKHAQKKDEGWPGRKLIQKKDEDRPVQLGFNPYEKDGRKCILCKYKVKLDYKNARLLQQFVSSFSGRVYDRHITGLCDEQYNILIKTITTSRKAGYMPIFVKDPKFLRDPRLFDPLKPERTHSYA